MIDIRTLTRAEYGSRPILIYPAPETAQDLRDGRAAGITISDINFEAGMKAEDDSGEPSLTKLNRCPFCRTDSKWRKLLTSPRIEVIVLAAGTEDKTATELELEQDGFKRTITVCEHGNMDNDVASLKYQLLLMHLDGVPNTRYLTFFL